MYFSDQVLGQLGEQYETVSQKRDKLFLGYLSRRYENDRAKEFAEHGFLRRVINQVRCIENVFNLIPPQSEEIPDKDVRKDAEINIQAFVLNTFGCIDNLSWIWVKEKNVTKEDGSALPNTWVGLSKRNKRVRSTFSKEFQDYLEKLEEWNSVLVEFRDALAHRIPFYIPPYVVFEKNREEYQRLDQQIAEASAKGDYQEHERLTKKQLELVSFRPWMQHSFYEEAKPLVFHAQMLADFLTIDELAQEFLQELDR